MFYTVDACLEPTHGNWPIVHLCPPRNFLSFLKCIHKNFSVIRQVSWSGVQLLISQTHITEEEGTKTRQQENHYGGSGGSGRWNGAVDLPLVKRLRGPKNLVISCLSWEHRHLMGERFRASYRKIWSTQIVKLTWELSCVIPWRQEVFFLSLQWF